MELNLENSQKPVRQKAEDSISQSPGFTTLESSANRLEQTLFVKDISM